MKILTGLLLSLSLLACEKQSVMEQAGEAIDDAGEEVADAVDDAREEVDEALD